MITIKLPPAWSLEFVHGLEPGDVYLSELDDPERDDSHWSVAKLAVTDGRQTSVWHVDAALDGPPSAVFDSRDGVFVADYSNQRFVDDYRKEGAGNG